MVKKMKVHLVKKKDVTEIMEFPFADVKEASIDPDNYILKDVCLFGTRESANDRIYQDKAIASLALLAEGANCYADLPAKSELKDRDGVRSIRDWIGVFEGARRNGDRVFANLKVREAYFDLMRDIALLQPKGTGMSINARVKVFSDNTGKESVVDMDLLRSVDAVSSAATTSNLWENLTEKMAENQNENEWVYRELAEQKINRMFEEAIASEGIIQDKLDNDKLKKELAEVTWIANDLINKIIYDDKKDISKKKSEVMAVFDDLAKEVGARVKKIKEQINYVGDDNKMEFTLEDVKANKEIFEAIINEYKEKENVQRDKDTLEIQKTEIENLKKTIEDKDKEIVEGKDILKVNLEKQKELEKKLDDIEVSERKAVKSSLAQKLIAKAGLLKEDVTDIFMKDLMRVEEYTEDEGDDKKVITVKEQMKERIKDRKKLVEKDSGKIKNSGEEFFEKETTEAKEEIKNVDEEVDKYF